MTYLINSLIFSLLTFLSSTTYAHELWMLTPEKVKYLNEAAKPIIFTQLTLINTCLTLAFIFALACWIFFNRRIKVYSLDAKLKSYSAWSAFILRLCTACMLIICAFNLIPRQGFEHVELTALLAPDLTLSVDSNWYWLKFLEILIAACLIVGIFLRTAIVFLLFVCAIVIFLFGEPALQYIGFYLGISIYLYTQPPGKFASLANKKMLTSLETSTFLLQLLTGLAFIYSALSYKFLRPNLDIAIFNEHHAFTFGIPYDYFVFIMCLVEIGAGFLIITGYGLRLLSLFLLVLFSFLSFDVSENIMVHIFIYGILITFIINGGTTFDRKK